MNPFEAHILIQQGFGAGLEEALKTQNLNPNSRFKQESLLSTAIKKKAPNLLQLLLHHGGDPNLVSYENGRYEPAIITAVRYKSLTCVQILLSCGANLDKGNFYGTDAIFQAVHENAFDILDYLMDNYHPPYVPLPLPSPSSSPSILIQERAEVGSTRGATFKLKELPSNNKEHVVDDDHVLCPFYYALSYATSYQSKRQSLVRLLKSYYKCKCLEEIASCTKLSSSELLPLPAVARFPPKDGKGNERKVETEHEREIRKCLIMLLASPVGQDHSPQKKLVGVAEGPDRDRPGVLVDFGNGDDIKFQNEFNYPYKIYKIKRKCHTIKENESSGATRPSSSYVFLTGPLKLSCIVREVIRDQILLYAMNSISSRTNSPPPITVFAPSTTTNANTNNVVIRNRNTFGKCLRTLPIPPTLMDFLLYKNIDEMNTNVIQLMGKDTVLNTKYFSIYICK
ncbi:unnamed protein product [Orchesella dallaii]|uniref:SOCS box domain-containing protein n=1 Tax=Orchesella dallaii TaxID=48710 RepID=A0ABP1QK17_9HEXA